MTLRDAQAQRYDQARRRWAETRQILNEARADHDAATCELAAAGQALAERVAMFDPRPEPRQLTLTDAPAPLARHAVDPTPDPRPWSRAQTSRRPDPDAREGVTTTPQEATTP